MEPTGEAQAPAPPRHPYPLLFWGAAAAVLLLDQATKAAVRTALERGESWPDWDFPFRFTYIVNTGAAWGILEDQTAFLIVMATIGIGAIYLYYRNPPYNHWSASLGIGLLLGGALGNLTDRIRLGHVTDFFDPDNFPAFNIADSAINVGIFVLIVGWLVWGSGEGKPRTENPGPGADAGSPADS
jgi:signal peptidase II